MPSDSRVHFHRLGETARCRVRRRQAAALPSQLPRWAFRARVRRPLGLRAAANNANYHAQAVDRQMTAQIEFVVTGLRAWYATHLLPLTKGFENHIRRAASQAGELHGFLRYWPREPQVLVLGRG